MKTIANYLNQITSKLDTSKTLWVFAGEHADPDVDTEFKEFVRECANGGTLPENLVFEIVAKCIISALECKDADSARDNEPPYPVYTSEINEEYLALMNVLEATYDEYKEYMFIAEKEVRTPSIMNQAHLYGYYNMVYSTLISFLENDKAWDDEPQAA